MRAAQPSLPLVERRRWGGVRRGAGRKRLPGRRPSVAHRTRPQLDARHPALITLRARTGVDWLRTPLAYRSLECAFAAASSDAFRVVHFSVQTDHVHLIVEADSASALSRGMRGLAIRCALAVNRAVQRRGALWADRYHASSLHTPRMVRNALVYVLANVRKHLRVRRGIDPCSSARFFDGFREGPCVEIGARGGDAPTRAPRTWLLRVGWRRHGLLTHEEAPATSRHGCRAR
jgi:REP element-mobilizing transposase RayT